MNTWLRSLPLPTFPFFHRRGAPARPKERSRPTVEARGGHGRLSDDSPQLEERRGAALRQMFPKVYTWCANRSDWSRALEVHAYLEQATSVDDLERRIRAVERRHHLHASD